VAQHERSGGPGERTTALLGLAAQLRATAADADRPDVVAKVDEVMLLIVGEGGAADNGAGKAGPGKADTVLRLLNGLGY
jgi:hypothetical protein